MSEALLNHMGQGRFKAYSAGSHPRENQQPNPIGLAVLREAGIATEGLYSKSWDEFAQPHAPKMDLVITVCDHAAAEVCPYWPGQPATAHWGYADPSAVGGDETAQRQAFRDTLQKIRQRLTLLVQQPDEALQKDQLVKLARTLAQSHVA